MVLLSDAVGATPINRELQIAQQPETTQQNATRAAAGSSGSPIVSVIGGDPYIVALNNGEAKNLQTGQDIINFVVKISTIEEASRGN